MIDALRVTKQGMEQIWGAKNNSDENLKAYAFYSMQIDEDDI